MRYLPFILISLVLYTLFFYNNQQPNLLSPESVNTGKKIVPLNFVKLAEQDKQQNQTISLIIQHPVEQSKRTVSPIPLSITTKTVQKSQPSSPPVQVNKAQLLASIKTTPASETALLKGELYEQDFHLNLPAPPIKKRPAKKKTTVVTTSLSSQLLKQKKIVISKPQNSTASTNETTKPKRSFKKQVKPTLTAVKNELGLQEAIAVSGNKPHYPKKAKANKQQGIVTIKFTVTMQGKSKRPKIIRSSGHKTLDNAVLEFIKKEHFMPALKGIEKVTSEQLFSFKFELI